MEWVRALGRRVKRAVGAPLALLALAGLRATHMRAGLALVYHEVGEQGDPERDIVPAHGSNLFAAQVMHLRRRYRVVPARELRAATAARRRGERFPVAVTFDDDLASHAKVARPVLEHHGLPATFFLSGASLQGPFSFWWERLQRAADRGLVDPSLLPGHPLAAELDLPVRSRRLRSVARAIERLDPATRDELSERLGERLETDPPEAGMRSDAVRTLAQAGFDIGFHTRRHYRLPTLDDCALRGAMVEGREELAGVAKSDSRLVAYPHGAADDRVAASARSGGLVGGFTVERAPVRPGTDALLIPRLQPTFASPGHFALELVGVLAQSLRRAG